MAPIVPPGGKKVPLLPATPEDTPQAIPAMKTVDAAKVAEDVVEPGQRPGRRGGALPLMFGVGALNLGRARVLTEAAPIEPTGEGPVDALRRDVLSRTGKAHYSTHSAQYALHRGAGVFAPAGPIGYGYVGGAHTRGVEVSSIRLGDPEGPPEVPTSADALLAMAPGEAVKVTREGETKLFGGTLKCHLDQDIPGGWAAGGPVGVDLGLVHQGVTSTDIVRGTEEAALVTVSSDTDRTTSLNGGIHVGLYLSWAMTAAYELGRRLGSASKTATEMASMPVWREHTSGAFVGVSRGRGGRHLAEIRLDLSRPQARKAYEAMVRGDLDVARALASEPNSGIEIPFSLEGELRKTVIPVSLGLFGIGVDWERGTEHHTTRAQIDGQRIARTKEISTRSRGTTSLTLRTTTHRASVETAHTETEGELPEGIRGDWSAVTWRHGSADRTTSREEVLQDLDLAATLLGKDAPEALAAYREKIAALDPSRFGWIGPRDEAGRTTVDLTVRLAPDAASRLAELPEDAIYAALAKPPAPEWADPAVRAAYDRESTDGRLEWKELSPGYLCRRHDYFEARQLVRTLQGIAHEPPAARQRALRDLIGTGRHSQRNLTLIAELLGPDSFALELTVDSDEGKDGAALDFSLQAGDAALRGDRLEP